MGLDLYVGTLARYHTGEWEPEAVSVGREAGLAVEVHYAQQPAEEAFEKYLCSDGRGALALAHTAKICPIFIPSEIAMAGDAVRALLSAKARP